MKLSSFQFFAIADNSRGLLVGAQGYKAGFSDGYHQLILVDKYGTEKIVIDKSWDDMTEIASQLNKLLIED